MIPLRDANPTARPSVLTIGLIAANFVIFAYELWLEQVGAPADLERFFTDFGVVPAQLTADPLGGTVPAAAALLTSQFLHGGWMHILGNMLYLWIFGNNVEDLLGRLPFLLFYLGGGIVAGLAQVAIDPASDVPLVGASGAIAAVLGAYLVWFPRARVLSLVFLGLFYQLVSIPAIFVLGFWFVLQLLDGVAVLGATSSAGGVAYFAHIGGFAAGLAVAGALRMAGLVRVPLRAG